MKFFFTILFIIGFSSSNAQTYFESFEDWTFVSPILYPENWTFYPAIDPMLLNVERVSSLNNGLYAINLKSNIPHFEGNFSQTFTSDLSFFSDTINIRFTYKCTGLGKCRLWIGQGKTGSTGVNFREIWVVNAGDTLVKTVVLENVSINPPFNEFRKIQFIAYPVETHTGSYGVSFFTIDSLEVQNASILTSVFGTKEIMDIKVYPNPAEDYVVFEIPNQNIENQEIIITDILGHRMELLHVKCDKTVWDTRRIQSGAYFYKTNINGIIKAGKILVNN